MLATADRSPKLVRFGIFEADLRACELRKHGLQIKLHNQSFLVLAALLERPGEVVTREELYRLLWPEQTYVDFEHNLNTVVKKLRRALSDTADTPRFVETLAKRGYRFVAPVIVNPVPTPSVVQPELQVVAPQAVEPVAGRRMPHWRWALIAAVCLLMLAAGLAIYRTLAVKPAPPEIVPLNTASGTQVGPAFSPDGRSVAYAWDGPTHDRMNIYVQEIGSSTPRRLTQYAGDDCSPVFSPDGRYIAFTREHRELMMVPVAGGPERRIAAVQNFWPMSLGFTGDGQSVATIDAAPGTDGQSAVFLVSLATGQKRQLTFPPSGKKTDRFNFIDVTFRFSPDFKQLAFIRGRIDHVNNVFAADIYVMPSTGGAARHVTSDGSFAAAIDWTADGRELLFSSRRSGPVRIWRVPVSGGEARLFAEAADGGDFVSIAREGRRLAYAIGIEEDNIWRVALSQPGNRTGPRSRLIASSRLNHDPDFSPDGKRIVFLSDRSGHPEVWIANSDGSEQRPLATAEVLKQRNVGTARWSPNSDRIVFDLLEGLPDPSNIFTYISDLKGGPPRRLGGGPGGTSIWSKDGERFYFWSTRSGSWEVWRRLADGSNEQQLTHSGGWRPKMSPDGSTVFYEKPADDDPEIWKIPAAGGKESRAMVLRNGEPVRVVGSCWGIVEDGIYFVKRLRQAPLTGQISKDKYELEFFRFSTSVVEPITGIGEVGDNAGGLAVSPDRRAVIYGQKDRDDTQIMIMNNFR